MLRSQGHSVSIAEIYDGTDCDLMIAIHAWRSALSIAAYRDKFPLGPLVVALSGTDVNTFLKTEPQKTLHAMRVADTLICLHSLIKDELPSDLQCKLHLVYQSARPLLIPRKPRTQTFGVSVIGHLREEKDPFRAALAARLMPAESRLRVYHFGKAHTDKWARQAKREAANQARYVWKGEVSAWQVRRELARTHVMVISSNQEGGANIVSESIAAGVPIIASSIPGNVGLLGRNYPGYYPVRDERALADIFWLAEDDPTFLPKLLHHVDKLRPKFSPAGEARALAGVIEHATKAPTK
tara:strand:- start:2213 stop:3103 length:891 start_codon:yes stop_codon:yes gene_type:complete